MSSGDDRIVAFFDIDNCLYSKNLGVAELMAQYIEAYFTTALNLSPEEASRLQRSYYRDYGLAIEGLVRHHQVDAIDYNAKVDDALPLEDIIKPDPALRSLLEKIDRTKIKLWLFTNAYVNHAWRVVRLLGIHDLFEGLTFCDYGKIPMICKPMPEMFERAMQDSGAGRDVSRCYFVDDSPTNVRVARSLGWNAICLREPPCDPQPDIPVISSLEELQTVWSPLFVDSR